MLDGKCTCNFSFGQHIVTRTKVVITFNEKLNASNFIQLFARAINFEIGYNMCILFPIIKINCK